jgi:aminoglycoside phosphotransferase (APT) family kinase protein
MARQFHTTLRFAHGDLTARNVIATDKGPVLIDWEWAGLYPPGYDRAFLWFSLIDIESGRLQVEVDEPAFLLSALLIQLWHLQWYVPEPFVVKHMATRDELVARLLA